MKVTAKAEYACAAMMELAASWTDDAPVRIQDIAKAHAISDRYLVHALLQLKRAGLVVSVRGKAGGYRLARAPETITLADIVAAIDDRSLMPNDALSGAKRTRTVSVLLDVWTQVREQEQRLLERLSLAELRRRTEEQGAFVYQI